MTKLSVCIPVEAGMAPPEYVVRHLLADASSSIEVIVAFADHSTRDVLGKLALTDPRLKILAPFDSGISLAQLWIKLVQEARGDWLTVINPQDMLEPALPQLLQFVEIEVPGADALSWNAFQIDESTPIDVPANVVVPILHNVVEIDKTKMLQAFFQWQGAQRTPIMPFGLFHGAIKRSLAETVIAASGPLAWLTLAPQHEWSARVLLFANGLALSNRPLSAAATTPFPMRDVPSALQGFPFDARLGITAVIAEIQARVLHELGGEWSGFNESFIRACLYDCVMEHDRHLFPLKCQRYLDAIKRMPGGGELSSGFQPQYMPHLPPNSVRGKADMILFVDRFIGGAKTAQEFYGIVNDMLTPIRLVTSIKAPEDDGRARLPSGFQSLPRRLPLH